MKGIWEIQNDKGIDINRKKLSREEREELLKKVAEGKELLRERLKEKNDR